MEIKTLFIAPYPAMAHLIEDCSREDKELVVTTKVANLEEALPFVKQAEAVGVDMIISRGGTSKMIELETNVPVIDIHVSGYDMLRVLTLTNDFPGKKAIVGFSNITLGAKTITDLLDIAIEVFTVEHAEEVEPLLYELKSKGFELIMGDVVTIEAAVKFGLEGILIQSGREAILDAFQRVKSVYHTFQKKQVEIDLLKSILKTKEENLLVLDENGDMIFEQWKSISSPPVPPKQLMSFFQHLDSRPSAMVIEGDRDQKIKMHSSRLDIKNEKFFQFVFSELKSQVPSQGNIEVEAVPQLPMIINESTAMKDCLKSISTGSLQSTWVLLGEKGTEKDLMARYIHHLKYEGTGLFASLHAIEAIKWERALDEDIRTLYIHGAEENSFHQTEELMAKCRAWSLSGMNIILSLERETDEYASFIFGDHTNRIYIPPLRNRIEDIKPLAAYCIAYFHQQYGTSAIKLKEDGIELLEEYSWPGNVAELKAFLYDLVAGEKGYTIDKDSVEKRLALKRHTTFKMDESLLVGTLEEIERRIIQTVMEEEDQNQTKVSKRLGINRSTLWRKLKQ